MPFLLILALISSVIYANEVKIKNTFGNLNKICIYNSTNSKLEIKLEDKSSRWATVKEALEDYSGVIKEKNGLGKVTIKPDNLRSKVIYYHLYLSGPSSDIYKLYISGNEDGIMASRCPSDAIAKVANTSPQGIAEAGVIAGVLSGFIFFAGLTVALIAAKPEHEEEWN